MAILNKLKTIGSPYSKNNGATPTVPNFKGSKLHYQYSLNGEYINVNDKGEITGTTMASAEVMKLRPPSLLDLNGKTPTKYSDQKFE